MNDHLAEMYQESQRQMREALEAVEWFQSPWDEAQCPWCGNCRDEGHRPDCQRQAALGKQV